MSAGRTRPLVHCGGTIQQCRMVNRCLCLVSRVGMRFARRVDGIRRDVQRRGVEDRRANDQPMEHEMSGVPRYEILRTWLADWEKMFKQPNQLLLGVYFETIAAATLAELHAKPALRNVERSSKHWIRELFGWLEEGLAENQKIVELIGLEHPGQVAELRTLLKAGTFDAPRIAAILEQIEGSPSLHSLGAELYRTLSKSDAEGHKQRIVASGMLARRVLLFHEPAELAKVPSKELAAGAVARLVASALRDLQSDAELNAGLAQLWPLALSPTAMAAGVLTLIQQADPSDSLLDRLSSSRVPGF